MNNRLFLNARFGAPVLAATTLAATTLAATVLAASAFAADIDPFTGQNMAIEQTRAVLELTKQQNALLEAETKKARAEYMLKNSDKIFAAELRKQLSVGQNPYGGMNYPAERFPEPEAPKKSAKKVKLPLLELPAAASQPLRPSGPALIGVMQRNGTRIALVQNGAETVYAKVGDDVPGLGRVSIIGEHAAVIGGRQLHVEAQAIANADPQDISQIAKAAINPGAPTGVVSSMQNNRINPARFGQ